MTDVGLAAINNQPKLDLVYVASIGRSGSTLLESMLGAHSAIETTGELHLWPHEIMQGGVQLCGSGFYVQACPFWIEMRRRVSPLAQPGPQLHFFRELHNGGRTLRRERLREFKKTPLATEVARQVQQYGQNNYDLFAAFRDLVEETTGKRPQWVVDASKDPYRLLWLLRSGMFNIKVVHLVKNPRGFIYSATKKWNASDDPLRMVKRLYYTGRQSVAWVIQNRLFSQISANHLAYEDYRLVQYERLAAMPKETFRQLCEMIGIGYEEEAVDHFRQGSSFAIAGNPMRYETRGIMLDEKWKTKLPSSSRRLAEMVTRFSMSDYGYS